MGKTWRKNDDFHGKKTSYENKTRNKSDLIYFNDRLIDEIVPELSNKKEIYELYNDKKRRK